jgi:hypothetical protein
MLRGPTPVELCCRVTVASGNEKKKSCKVGYLFGDDKPPHAEDSAVNRGELECGRFTLGTLKRIRD